LFHKYGRLIKVVSNIADCRDQKDNFLLNLAIDSNADYLVTSDSDLLTLNHIKKTKIITWNDFIRELMEDFCELRGISLRFYRES